jgi:hypothetical protein
MGLAWRRRNRALVQGKQLVVVPHIELMAVDVIVAEMLDDGNLLAAATELSEALSGSSAFVAMQPTAR